MTYFDVLTFDSDELTVAEEGDWSSVQLAVSSVSAEILVALHNAKDKAIGNLDN